MIAQTRIIAPKNKYKDQDDIKLGSDASQQIQKQFPIINDADATAYIERVGRRLVAAIPPQFNQPAFTYRFKWVNASDKCAIPATEIRLPEGTHRLQLPTEQLPAGAAFVRVSTHDGVTTLPVIILP